jgi:hypothetical protein
VVDEKGTLVSGSIVSVEPVGIPMASAIPQAETDNNGRFVIEHLALTNYKVFAKKESANYPDTSFAFYSNHIFPTVTLTSTAPVADMLLKIGPPAAVVKGIVEDATSGTRVNATFLLRRALDPGNWISESQRPDYRVLAPPDVDVLLEVTAPGYKTWYYGGTADALKRPPIRLESRKEMILDVQLEPEENHGKQQ